MTAFEVIQNWMYSFIPSSFHNEIREARGITELEEIFFYHAHSGKIQRKYNFASLAYLIGESQRKNNA